MNIFIDVLKIQKLPFVYKENLLFLEVANSEIGAKRAEEVLFSLVNLKTVLFLSGGTTPKELYRNIALSGESRPGAVAQVDERYGEPFHKDSNQKMIRDSGLLKYLEEENIRFYPVLNGKSREQTARDYDETVRYLLMNFHHSIAVMGIGRDGHTAGIAPNRSDVFLNPLFEAYQKGLVVSEFNDPESNFKERITITFHGLSMIDAFIILAFGDRKKYMFKKLLQDGPEEEIPARFYKRSEIANKTLIITDQEV